MKKACFLLSCSIVISFAAWAVQTPKFNLLIAPGTITENSVTLLWDKQFDKNTVLYEIIVNGGMAGSTGKTNYTLSNLIPGTEYTVRVRIKQPGKKFHGKLNSIKFRTTSPGKIYNILDYGARADRIIMNVGCRVSDVG